jgi:hypothetical protein
MVKSYSRRLKQKDQKGKGSPRNARARWGYTWGLYIAFTTKGMDPPRNELKKKRENKKRKKEKGQTECLAFTS